MDMLEIALEPRLALKIPDLFLQNVLGALDRSIQAWKSRFATFFFSSFSNTNIRSVI